MTEIKITDHLIGSLSEAYYKEFCDQHGWAFISLEHIHERGINKGILKFTKGFDRIFVKIPFEIIPEIEEISRPSNRSLNQPSYVYDFLACDVSRWKEYPPILDNMGKKDFRWIEVKTGNQQLGHNQVETSKKVSIKVFRYRVPFPLPEESPRIYDDEVNEDYLKTNNPVGTGYKTTS